ncbi:DUF2345 domain-containing protein, partial [Acinetobacter haemolyticus]
KALSEVAKNQQTDELEALEQLKAFAEDIQQDIAKFNKALLLLSSPNGIGLSTSEDIHLSADGQLNQFAGDSINLTTQKNLIAQASQKISLFAAQGGIKQVAGKGKVEIQAQGDGADLIARNALQVTSTEGRIEITAKKKIVILAGGSQLEINGGGIFPTTGGKFEAKAGQHLFMGGSSVEVAERKFNSSPCYLTYQVTDSTGQPLKNKNYVMYLADGTIKRGRTNAKGETEKVETAGPQKVNVLIEDDDHKGYQISQLN